MSDVYTRKVLPGGKLNIPKELVKELNWKPGDILNWEVCEVLSDVDGKDVMGVVISKGGSGDD